jgi:hypothetical protein
MHSSLTVILLACFIVPAQKQADAPFAELDRQVKQEQGGLNGDHERLSKLFDAERKRLGNKFESELLKYIEGDLDKHYWLSAFLETPVYLHGNKPLPYLSLLIKQQGIAMLRGKTDEESLGMTVSLSVTAAVLSTQLGLNALAVSYKTEAERLLAQDTSMGAFFPAMDDEERRIYDALTPAASKKAPPLSEHDKAEPMPKATVSGGVLNGKAISLPKPRYPSMGTNVRVSGVVVVQIVFDETGNVIYAHAVSGHPLLLATSESAARQAKFAPVKLNGKAVKVSGVLTYQFVP